MWQIPLSFELRPEAPASARRRGQRHLCKTCVTPVLVAHLRAAHLLLVECTYDDSITGHS